ncbi:hypothetical protein ABKV19_008717 [Rosa sericea]
MSGSLPKSFQQLSQLRSLSLVFNQFSGSLPDFTGLPSLRLLFLSNNQFNGSIPESMGLLSSLEYLAVSWNSLTGALTEAHFSNLSRLRSLSIDHNPLSFNMSFSWNPPFQLETLDVSSCKIGPAFPRWIQKQRELTSLFMSNAGISDSVPNEFWDLSSSLFELNLSMNQIHGKLPDLSSKNCSYFTFDLSSNHLFGQLPPFPPNELLSLNLGNNTFSGNIPSTVGYLKNLVLLRLQDNKLSGDFPSLENCTELRVVDLGANRLSGRIPAWIGQTMTKLLVLRLHSNEFYGSLPLNLCGLPVIHVLDLSKNNISGALPHCLNNITAYTSMSSQLEDLTILGFVQLVWKGINIQWGENLKHLRSIDISSNYLSGDIPETMTSMMRLISPNLSRNNLTGVLPSDFGQLKSLESLDLSRNQLDGNIPSSLSRLNFLSVLNLSYNNLSGRIPLGTQLQSFNASAYMDNLGLCGPPLTPLCPGDATNQDSPATSGAEGDKTEQDEDGLITLGFYVSSVLGFIIGFWGFFAPLLLNVSWRIAYFQYLNDIKIWNCHV